MKLERLVLENFMGWAALDIDLSKYSGVLAVMGSIESDLAHSNGTGKSSLVAGINYCLYGSTPAKGINLDGMIHQVAGVAVESGYKASLYFSHNEVNYEIVRKKKLGATQKTTFKDLTNKRPMTQSPDEFLCMPEVVWQNTVFSAQRDLSAFVDKTPAVRKDILTEIFGMNNYLTWETKARQLAAKSEMDMANLTHSLTRQTEEWNQITATQADVDKLTAAIAETEAGISAMNTDIADKMVKLAGLTEKTAEADRVAGEIRAAEGAVSTLRSKLSSLESRWESKSLQYTQADEELEATVAAPPDPASVLVLQQEIQDAEALRPQLDALTTQYNEASNQKATATAEATQFEKTVWVYKSQIDKLPAGTCPLCGTFMTEEHLNKHKAGLQAEVDAAALACAERKILINNLSISLNNIREDMAKLSNVINTIPALSRKLVTEQQKKTAYDYAVAKLKSIGEEYAQASAAHTEALTELSAELTISELALENKRKAMPDVGDIPAQRDTLIQTKTYVEATLSEWRNRLAREQDARSRATLNMEHKLQLGTALATLAIEVDAARLKHNVNTELVKAFGPAGIPTLILENCLTELQQYLDYYMDLLSDGKIHVTFQTVKTNTTTAKTTETLNIMVSDINGERDIALYSGGETVRVYLAIRLALAKLLYLKSGQKLGLLIIDEIADLDDAGLLAFVELLKRIEPEFEQILLVSHLPELKNSFDNALVLSRDLEGNYVPV